MLTLRLGYSSNSMNVCSVLLRPNSSLLRSNTRWLCTDGFARLEISYRITVLILVSCNSNISRKMYCVLGGLIEIDWSSRHWSLVSHHPFCCSRATGFDHACRPCWCFIVVLSCFHGHLLVHTLPLFWLMSTTTIMWAIGTLSRQHLLKVNMLSCSLLTIILTPSHLPQQYRLYAPLLFWWVSISPLPSCFTIADIFLFISLWCSWYGSFCFILVLVFSWVLLMYWTCAGEPASILSIHNWLYTVASCPVVSVLISVYTV